MIPATIKRRSLARLAKGETRLFPRTIEVVNVA